MLAIWFHQQCFWAVPELLSIGFKLEKKLSCFITGKRSGLVLQCLTLEQGPSEACSTSMDMN